jgi:hypothetical protein
LVVLPLPVSPITTRNLFSRTPATISSLKAAIGKARSLETAAVSGWLPDLSLLALSALRPRLLLSGLALRLRLLLWLLWLRLWLRLLLRLRRDGPLSTDGERP